MGPVVPVAYRPAPPRPPEKPERRGWLATAGWAAGWVVVVAGGVLVARAVLVEFAAAEERATAKTEMEREVEHMGAVLAWVRDTSASATMIESAGRPAPTTERAKRVWAINRMLVDRTAWERETMERHGVTPSMPVGWGTPRYYANARAYPEVGRYLEDRAAAMAEIEKTSAAWMEARIAGLARESGMPVPEIRDLFPHDFTHPGEGQARLVDAMLEMHRHLVRMDPRVHHTGANQLRYEREDDVRLVQRMEAMLKAAADSASQGRDRKTEREIAALNRWIQ